MGWNFDTNGGLTTQKGLSAPTYKDPFIDFLGSNYYNKDMLDPALAMTLNAGGAGNMQSGLSAFINYAGNNQFNAMGAEGQGGSLYNDGDMQNLAKSMGIDVGDKTGVDLQNALNSQLKDYVQIGGMSAGWNPTGDVRGSNQTLYKRENGQLVPIQQGSNYSAPTKGSYVSDNPWVLAPLAVVGGGLAAAYLGAGAAGAGGATTTAGGAGSALGSLQSMWAGLPGWGQGALTGAAQGGISSGLQGQNVLRGALMGGLTGGVGAVGGQFLSGATGMPLWAGRAVTSAGLGGLTGGWQGALGGGLGSLAASGLSSAGLGGDASKYLGGVAGRLGSGLIGGALGGSGSGAGGYGGLSGGTDGGVAGTSQNGSQIGGLNPRLGAAQAQQAAWLRDSYAPVAAEAQKKKATEATLDELADQF